MKVQSQSHRFNLVMWLNRKGVASTAIIKRDYVKVNRSAGAREGVQHAKYRYTYANTPKFVPGAALAGANAKSKSLI